MRTRIVATPLALLALALSGCRLLEADLRYFEEERSYEHPLFETAEACEAARRSGVFNCSQWMDFQPDGRVDVVVTDIVNPGAYGIRDDRVLLSLEGTPELPGRMELVLSADGSTLTELGTGRIWTRVE